MSSNAKFRCLFLVCFSIVIASSSGCLTLPVSGYLGESKEKFLGQATGYMTRTGNLNITTISGVKCEGDFVYETSANGKGDFKCADGQFGDFLFTSNGNQGEGFGKTNKGEPFFFQFGNHFHGGPSQKTNKRIAEANRQEQTQGKKESTFRKEQTPQSGTGFLFGSQDYIVTNYHVVKGKHSIKAKFTNGDVIDADVISKDAKNDIAILKLKTSSSITSRELKFGESSKARMGEKVFTIGFPVSSVLGERPKYTEGVISAVTGIKDDPTVFQITVPIQPGNSGGPLFNQRGEVIGITTASLSLRATEVLGAIPQNINYALKSSFVKNLLTSIPESLLSNRGIVVVPKDSENSLADFIEAVTGNVVLIEAKE